MHSKQIFQTPSTNRWKRFKWVSRILFLAILISIVCVIITIASKKYPSLPDLSKAYNSYSIKNVALIKKSTKYKEFKVAKGKLVQLKKDRELYKKLHPNNLNRVNFGFFVDWDAQSYTSLSDHIDKLDMIIPEFFFVKKDSDQLTAKIDYDVIKTVKKNHKKILASVKNYINSNWDGAAVRRIILSPAHSAQFIDNLVYQLKKYRLDGVNIDFEELNLSSDEPLINFQKQLYETLHKNGLTVTQDISPDNEDYNVKELAKYNDYIFLMAYDQHTELSNPGDISHQDWVEEKLDKICREIPSSKVVLAIAGYGFDWPENGVGINMTYQTAISNAQQYQAKVVFDPLSANLHYNYTDNHQTKHEVYFTDAATNFNIMRKADDWGVGGIALWRLGSEDPRLWKFFRRDLSIEALNKQNYNGDELSKVELNDRINYTGDGEILDLVTTPKEGKLTLKIDSATKTIIDQHYVSLPTKYVINKFGQADKKIILTFDDGPDPVYTPQILSILKKEKVPATFFMVGIMAENNIPLVKAVYDAGYEIGNHTFFHPDLSKVSQARVVFELNATRKLIECITGKSTVLFRAPFNADAEPQVRAEVLPVAQSRAENYINVGESIDPQDWKPGITADEIVSQVIAQKHNGSIILLHDAGGDRSQTVEALPRIIDYFKKNGYQFITVADILGKTKAEVMPAVADDADSGLIGEADSLFVSSFFYGNKILYSVFLLSIFLAMIRLLIITVLALKKYRKEKKAPKNSNPSYPPVSILIPAYNEEVTAVKTIDSLLALDYPELELLFIDDGSKDKTLEVIKKAFGNNDKVKILSKTNGGKASALNYGISLSKHDFIVCIDADTQLNKDAIKNLLKGFELEDIAAIAGTVKVGNETNFLTKWQSIEYITSQNLDRRAFDVLNSITVIPGAIGAFRKKVLQEVGGFTSDTLAEDCDLTMRILKAGYIVKNCTTAIAYTEAPETFDMFLKQRFRWSYGVMQSFWKNRNALLNKKYGYFGMIGMPNILIFQIILPLFAPLADLFMLGAIVSGVWNLIDLGALNWAAIQSTFSLGTSFGQVVFYYILFVVVDLIFACFAFKIEKEPLKKLLYIIPQRFVWRQLMYYVLFKSLRKALKGEMSGWGALTRTGNVKARPN
ncbi:glycosyltransferase [Pedobacter sp. SD-b]|uniref:Glycosyltransferase n=1 Tax=Pedobacter segetis TaxID=2793069 RepID=A0ABS1BHA8_9SPHI|nr:glycosyltransferase [Pedobacter segetis]MBK0382267.1 glycosyltransferase [Pedobacter segetis]